MWKDDLLWIIGGHTHRDHPVFFKRLEAAYYYSKYELNNTNIDLIVEVIVDEEYLCSLQEMGNIIE